MTDTAALLRDMATAPVGAGLLPQSKDTLRRAADALTAQAQEIERLRALLREASPWLGTIAVTGDGRAQFRAVRDRIDSALSGSGDGWRPIEYVIWSNEHSMWWGPNRAGYAWRLSNAGRYTRDEALAVAKNARGGWPVEGAPPEIALPLADAEHCYPAPPAQEDGAEITLTPMHIKLLRRGVANEWIGLSDDSAVRVGEIASLAELHRMGLAEFATGPFPPGPPSLTPSVITDAGRKALAQEDGSC